MKLSRRDFIARGSAALAAGTSASRLFGANEVPLANASTVRNSLSAINRKALVHRHNPLLHKLDPLSPLSLGNGEFAFTADITGLQTFPDEFEKSMPLCTMSQWGWHTTPLPNGLDPRALRLTQYDTHGRSVGYHTNSEGQTELFNWLRQNPHRLNLARIGLVLFKGDVGADASDLSEINQELDLWSGTIESHFRFAGELVSVRTAVHPKHDLLAVEIDSPLLRRSTGRLGVRFGFAYGSSEMSASDWPNWKKHKQR